MATTIRAVFDGAVLRPEQPLDLQAGATYLVSIEHEIAIAPRPAVAATDEHPLTRIGRLATDMGVDDLAANHDWYAHGQLGNVRRTNHAGVTAMATVMGPPEQRVVLYDVSWETYESLLADHVDCQAPRLTYDRGTLEIVGTLSQQREEPSATLWSLVENIAMEWSIDTHCVGSMTFVHKGIQQGFSPDTAFYIQHGPHVRGVKQIDPVIHPPPDLVIEIDVSRESLDKLPVYAGFGVPEVWRVRGGAVTVYVRRTDGEEGYGDGRPSLALPPLDGEILTRFLAQRAEMGSVAWVKSIRTWAQSAAS